MSFDMSVPMGGMPDGSTNNVQVAYGSLLAGESTNKTPIFISGVNDNKAFLTWLWESCPSTLTAQLKAENLVVVPATGDGFRATVSMLWSLDFVGGVVTFHTYSVTEDRCVRLLIKNLGKMMPEGVVLQELGSLDIRVQGLMHLRFGRRDQDPAKNRHLIPISLCLWCGARRCPRCEP